MPKAIGVFIALLCLQVSAIAQEDEAYYEDSMYIEEVEQLHPAKVLHAEPLYIDLIRDLGARKGEREWNIGMGITDQTKYDNYSTLIEYEFAPMDRIGLEVELPFTFYMPVNGTDKAETPSHRVESIKMAGQWSFLVSPKYNTSMAVGYIHEFVFVDINAMTGSNIFRGNLFNPFFVAAKRFGRNFHTLLYTGPKLEKDYHSPHWHNSFEVNT
ncbi:MAG TPA: HAEPLYID family protein, partial [Flavipsychrobacter sp.]